MPTMIVAGNWKMNTGIEEATRLVTEMRSQLDAVDGVTKIVCPPFVSLSAVAEALRGSTVAVGAQNMHHESSGAFTGEVSSGMLAGLCEYVIVGHSERRQLFGETDEGVSLKAKAAQSAGLIPIVCVGETLEQREAGMADAVVERQVRGSLSGVHDTRTLVVAYEPVWAIGTGKAATPDVAQEVMARLRRVLVSIFGAAPAAGVPLLYGGSVNAGNASDFLGQADVNGALVGGASLDAGSFVQIVERAAEAGS